MESANENVVTVEFEYSIGQEVFIKRDVRMLENGLLDKNSIPSLVYVHQRLVDQCHGGLQLFYIVGVGEKTVRVAPHEILSFDAGMEIILKHLQEVKSKEARDDERPPSK